MKKVNQYESLKPKVAYSLHHRKIEQKMIETSVISAEDIDDDNFAEIV